VTFFSWDVLGPSTVLLGGLVLGVLVDRLVPRRTWLGSGIPATAAVVAALVLVVEQDRPGLLSLVAALGVLLVANVVNYEESMPPALFHAGVLVSAAGGVVAERVADVAGAVVALAVSALAATALTAVRSGDVEARRDARTSLSAVAAAAVVSFAGALVVQSDLDGALVGRGVLGDLGWFVYGTPDGLSGGSAAAVAVVAVLPLVVAGGLPRRFPVVVLPRASVVVAALLATVPAVSGALLVSQLLAYFAATGGHATLLPAELVVTLCLLGAAVGVLRATDLLDLVRWTTLGTSAVAVAGFGATDDVGVWLLVQVLAVVGLVGMLAVAARRRGGVEPSRLRGLVRTEPVMGVAVVVALLARAALPPSWTASTSAAGLLEAAWDTRWFLGAAVAVYLVAGVVAVLRAVAGLVARPTETVQLSPSPPVSIRVATTTVVLAALVLLLLPLSY
jgi:NADH-quinone oxidoreductase subunit N